MNKHGMWRPKCLSMWSLSRVESSISGLVVAEMRVHNLQSLLRVYSSSFQDEHTHSDLISTHNHLDCMATYFIHLESLIGETYEHMLSLQGCTAFSRSYPLQCPLGNR